MAKTLAPLMSVSASGVLGKAIVYFPWKGLNAVREYVIPANPKTTGQTTQRGYFTYVVDRVHAAMQHATNPLTQTDKSALALWGSTYPTPRTWFNQVVKNLVDQLVAGLSCPMLTQGTTTPGADQLAVSLKQLYVTITAGNIFYGTTKACTSGKISATCADPNITGTITGLTTGTKYYWQFRATAPAGCVGIRSGVYYGVPT